MSIRNATPDELRRALARALAAGLVAWRVDGYAALWACQSESKADSCYLVERQDDGTWRCGCEAGQRAIPCKHIAYVAHLRGELPASLVQTAEVTPLSRARRPLPTKPAAPSGPLTERAKRRRTLQDALQTIYGEDGAA